ncbi:TPA: hypothetical protein ACHHM1_002918 [Staphylococcus aureus]
MNYEEIRNILEDNNVREVLKAIFSFETGLQESHLLNQLVEFYLEHDMPNFLDIDIYTKSLEIIKDNREENK